MANMSYCRFRNTNMDVNDCIETLYEETKLSNDEFIACKNMFTNVLEFFEEYDVCEVDWDEFNSWLDTINRR